MRQATLPLLVLLTACASNYDFSKARLPNGEPDLPKLVADLAASGEESLHSFTWIPLIYLQVDTFKASKVHYPTGYTLTSADCYGPLFAGGGAERHVVDPKGVRIENEDWLWFGWGLLYHDTDENIETTAGRRHRSDSRFLLLLGNRDDVCYARTQN